MTPKFSHNELVGYSWPRTEGHIESVRGILVTSNALWRWIWKQNRMHDRMLADSGYSKLWARYRNQKGFLPRVEFEPGADIRAALKLLGEVGIREDDLLNIETAGDWWSSIGEYLDCVWA